MAPFPIMIRLSPIHGGGHISTIRRKIRYTMNKNVFDRMISPFDRHEKMLNELTEEMRVTNQHLV